MARTGFAYLGREFKPRIDNKTGRQIGYILDKDRKVGFDFDNKEHAIVISRSGGGKTYTANVLIEEMIDNINTPFAAAIIDRRENYSTFHVPNDNKDELEPWAFQLPGDVLPGALSSYTILVPCKDASKFPENSFDGTFALDPASFTDGMFAATFNLDPLEDQQVNLFREARLAMLERRKKFGLYDLVALIKERGNEFGFKTATMDALSTRLKALAALGIFIEGVPPINESIHEMSATIFDFSMSSHVTAKIFVEFLAEQLLENRTRMDLIVKNADRTGKRVKKPTDYLPPIYLVIDEAHEYFSDHSILNKCFKEGRNVSLMMMAISQSMDLTKHVYENITNILVGPMVLADEIDAVHKMIPVDITPADFKRKVRALKPGEFLYYNTTEQTENKIKIHPRKTRHLATTKIKDERQYFIDDELGIVTKPNKRVLVIDMSCGHEKECTINCEGRTGDFEDGYVIFDDIERDGKPVRCNLLTEKDLEVID